MSILNTVNNTRQTGGLRVVIAGQEKMGKTTMTTDAPGALLVPCEVGFAGVSVPKTAMLQSFSQVQQLVQEVMTEAQAGRFPFKSLVFDSVTAIERMVHDHVLQLDPAYKADSKKTVTMESAHGGYGRAYTLANSVFQQFLAQLDQLAVYGGINIIFTAHVFASKVSDPTAGEYDSWDLLLHSPKNQKTYGKREILTQWADVIGFIYEPVYLTTAEKSTMTRAVSQNKGRVLAISRTPSYTAGNRFGIVGELPLAAPPANAWNNFADALYKACGIDLFTR